MLRIIAGKYKSRLIDTPPDGEKTRPLPDRVRTSIHNMLHGHYEGMWFLDAFAGTGVFGLECLSRGAAGVVFIERDREIARLLKSNVEKLGADERARVVQADALGPLVLAECPKPVHVVFFDPPYPIMEDPEQRVRVWEQFARCVQMLDEGGFGLIRTPWPYIDHMPADERGHHAKIPISLEVPGAVGPETHTYGSTAVHWYAREKAGVSNRES